MSETIEDTGQRIPHLRTSIPGVYLRELKACDASAYYALVQCSRQHLTHFGDYIEMVAASQEDHQAAFATSSGANLRTGIFRGMELIGQVDLNRVDENTYALGYWIGAVYGGHGYTTEACRCLIEYAHMALEVSEFWAGVREQNLKSIALLKRLGFTLFERHPTHLRYHMQFTYSGIK